MGALANERLVREIFEAFARRRGFPLRGVFAEDAIWTVPGAGLMAGVYRGRDEILPGLRNAPNVYPAGLHLADLAIRLGRERVRRAELVLRLLGERAPELVEDRGADRPDDLAIPEP